MLVDTKISINVYFNYLLFHPTLASTMLCIANYQINELSNLGSNQQIEVCKDLH